MIILGFIICLVAVAVINWNENRTIRITSSFSEVINDVVSVKAYEAINPMHNGRLVHVCGSLKTGEPLTDPEYNLMMQVVLLKKRVQMLQWVEESVEHKYDEAGVSIGNEDRSYFYTMEWRDEIVDSRNFYVQAGYQNPNSIPIENRLHIAKHVHIGQYELGDKVKVMITNFREVTSDTRPEDTSVKMHSGFYYHAYDIHNLVIGDIRIHFSFAGLEGEYYTVIGKLDNHKIIPYLTSHGRQILLLTKGEHTVEDVVKMEQLSQLLITWFFRLIGFLLLFISININNRNIYEILLKIPVIGHLAQDLLGSSMSFILLALSAFLVTISTCWLFYKPLISGVLFMIAILPWLLSARNATIRRHELNYSKNM